MFQVLISQIKLNLTDLIGPCVKSAKFEFTIEIKISYTSLKQFFLFQIHIQTFKTVTYSKFRQFLCAKSEKAALMRNNIGISSVIHQSANYAARLSQRNCQIVIPNRNRSRRLGQSLAKL